MLRLCCVLVAVRLIHPLCFTRECYYLSHCASGVAQLHRLASLCSSGAASYYRNLRLRLPSSSNGRNTVHCTFTYRNFHGFCIATGAPNTAQCDAIQFDGRAFPMCACRKFICSVFVASLHPPTFRTTGQGALFQRPSELGFLFSCHISCSNDHSHISATCLSCASCMQVLQSVIYTQLLTRSSSPRCRSSSRFCRWLHFLARLSRPSLFTGVF
jgi:hypothetical protein